MVELTPNQADTLLKIVNFANQHGGRIPTGPEFAKILGIGTRGALARIRRVFGSAAPAHARGCSAALPNRRRRPRSGP